MEEKCDFSQVSNFFQEIYNLIKNSKRELDEPWYLINQVECLKKLNDLNINQLSLTYNFIKYECWNYISINKIRFILESLSFLKYDIRNLSKILDYRGFEQLIKEILNLKSYNVVTNFRFSDQSSFKFETFQKRYEIDILGLKENILLLIDAKQWNKKASFNIIDKVANLQFQRIVALKKNPEILYRLILDLIKSDKNIKNILPLKLLPVVITLEENSILTNKIRIPLVSIYKLNSFLQELKINIDLFNYIKINKIFIQKMLSKKK